MYLRLLDRHGHALSVGRKPRVPIDVWRRGQRLFLPHPDLPTPACAGPTERPPEYRSTIPLRKCCNVWLRRRLQDAVQHGDRCARNREPLGIERHGHQVSPLRIDQVAGGHVAGLRPCWD